MLDRLCSLLLLPEDLLHEILSRCRVGDLLALERVRVLFSPF